MRRTGTGLLEVRDFLRMKLDDLWLPVHKSSTSVRQRSGRCWHPARASTGCEQNGGNLTQLSHKLQPCLVVYKAWKFQIFFSTTAAVTRLESFFFGGGVTWPNLVTWTYNFQESCGRVVRTAMQKKKRWRCAGRLRHIRYLLGAKKKLTFYSKATRKEVWQAGGNMTSWSIGTSENVEKCKKKRCKKKVTETYKFLGGQLRGF